MDAAIWPFAALRIRTPMLELRYPDDDDLVALARLAAEGIHDADTMPFNVPWTRLGGLELQRSVLQHGWRQRASLTREDWCLPFVVCADGEPLGIQAIEAKEFAVRRTVETGSWLVQRAQGKGVGTEMRAAVLHFAFAGLDADEAVSGSFADNPRSAAVSRRNGYQPNGEEVRTREGAPARLQRWVLARDRWRERRRDDITLDGLADCLPLPDVAHTPCAGRHSVRAGRWTGRHTHLGCDRRSSMLAVIVTFSSPDGFDREKLRGIAEHSRGKFEGLPGLRSKVFSVDADGRRARNVHLWDDEATARDFFDDDLTALVTELYGAAPTVEFVEVVGYVDNAR